MNDKVELLMAFGIEEAAAKRCCKAVITITHGAPVTIEMTTEIVDRGKFQLAKFEEVTRTLTLGEKGNER